MAYLSYCCIFFSIVCLCERYVETLTDDVISSELALFSKFLGIQSKYCANVNFCTIRNWRNITFDIKDQQCCRQCSCEMHCEQDGSCCPDFWLRDIIGEVKYGSIQELMNATEHLDSSKMQNVSFTLPVQLIHDNTCVSSRLITRSIVHGFHEVDEAYIMVSKCPLSYGSNVIKSKCEEVSKIKSTVMNELIPVTSTATRQTYRNIFCLKCNEGLKTDFLPWKCLLTCSSKHVMQNFIKPPMMLFERIALTDFTFCNIVFKPSDEIESFVDVCKQTDVSSCQNTLTSHTMYDTAAAAIYEQLCSRYYLPVLMTQSRTYTIFKNIACYLCNMNESFVDRCRNSYPTYKEYQLEINVLSVTLNDTNPSQGALGVISSLSIYRNNKCNEGYIFDEKMKMCRKILCPRHLYIYDGSCVPVISHVNGVFFSMVLEVKPDIRIKITDALVEQYENKLESILENELKLFFNRIHIDVWRKIRNNTLQSNIVSIKFKHYDKAYSDMIQRAEGLLLRINRIKFQIGPNVIGIDADIADHLIEINHHRRAVDRETKSTLYATRVSTEFSWEETELKLSKGHFCYRLELNISELVNFGRNGFKVASTGVRVEGAYHDVTEQGNGLVCIDDVIQINAHTENKKVIKFITDTTSDLTVFIIFGTLIALTVVVVIGRLIFSCLNRPV